MKYKNMNKKLGDSIAISKSYCKCGHSIVFLPSTPKTICGWCGRTVINNSKSRFTFMLGKELHNDSTSNSNDNITRINNSSFAN